MQGLIRGQYVIRVLQEFQLEFELEFRSVKTVDFA